MDMEDRVRKLEKENVSTNNKLWELTARVSRMEQLIADFLSDEETVGDGNYSLPNGEEVFAKLSSFTLGLNQLLPQVGVLLGVKNPYKERRSSSIQSNISISSILLNNKDERKTENFKQTSAPKSKAATDTQKPKSTATISAPVSNRKSKNKTPINLSEGDSRNVNHQAVKRGKRGGRGQRSSNRSGGVDDGESSSYETMSDAESLPVADGKRKSTFKPCRKLCGGGTGHPCQISHDPADPCPPCQKLMTDLKLKCGHRTSILCHRQNKVSDFCSECESKRLIHEAPVISSLPVISFAFDSMQSPAEMNFKRVREILKKISSSNFDKLSEDLVSIVNCESKFLPEFANLFVERAVLDATNQQLVLTYSKLISVAVNPPSGKLTMLSIEVSSTLFTVVALLFKFPQNQTPPAFVASLLRKREVIEMGEKSRNYGVLRFVGELYMHNVVELGDLKDRLIEPLLDKATDEHLDYLCKILTLVGSKLNGEIMRIGKASDVVWFDGLFARLEPLSLETSRLNSVRFAVENVIELKKVGWDRFRKKETGMELKLEVVEHIPAITPPPPPAFDATQVPKIPSRPKKSSSKQAQDSSTLSLFAGEKDVNGTACFLDMLESAPWGEHTDPLSTLPPIPQGFDLSSFATGFPKDVPTGGRIPEGSAGKSATSSHTVSPAVSLLSLPSKPVNKSDALNLFKSYLPKDSKPQKDRIQWLRQKFNKWNEKQRLDLICNLSRVTGELEVRKEFAAMGHLLDVLIRAELITEEMVTIGFKNGIMADLPNYYKSLKEKDFNEIVEALACSLVTCWEQRLDSLSWLVDMGQNVSVKNPHAWEIFSLRILGILHDRKKMKAIRILYQKTNPKEVLGFAARALQII